MLLKQCKLVAIFCSVGSLANSVLLWCRFSSQETPSQESTGLAAAIREKCSVQALFSALKEQQVRQVSVCTCLSILS